MTSSHSRSPVLVTGMHRSGTSWVGSMLCAGQHQPDSPSPPPPPELPYAASQGLLEAATSASMVRTTGARLG
jgi:hypothetical protein